MFSQENLQELLKIIAAARRVERFTASGDEFYRAFNHQDKVSACIICRLVDGVKIIHCNGVRYVITSSADATSPVQNRVRDAVRAFRRGAAITNINETNRGHALAWANMLLNMR